MSDTDKTGDKLVASIRKTRAGASNKSVPPKAAGGTGAAGAGKQPATGARSAGKSAKATTTEKAATTEKRVSQSPQGADPFQYGRRVWPD